MAEILERTCVLSHLIIAGAGVFNIAELIDGQISFFIYILFIYTTLIMSRCIYTSEHYLQLRVFHRLHALQNDTMSTDTS